MPTPNAAGGEGTQADLRWMPQQPFQFFPQPLQQAHPMHPYQFMQQQMHPLQFVQQLPQHVQLQQRVHNMQPVQYIPQVQQQPQHMHPLQPRPQLPHLQQRPVQPAAEEQPPAPVVPLLPPQQEQTFNRPAENTDLHHMAPMNNTCQHCGAKYFKEELKRQTTRLRPLQGQQPKYAELYIMDTAEALEHRTNNPSNKNLNKDTIKKLQDELLAVNPYAQEYKHIGEILQQQQEEATAANEPIPTFDMIITSRANQDRRYDSPAASEIAAIYSTRTVVHQIQTKEPCTSRDVTAT
eukprot:gene1336-biopygen1066